MEKKMPLLTIVTVTWNCAETLEKTLLSVEAVKTDAMEYIIIDGGSSDGTLDIIDRYKHLADHLTSEPDKGIYNAMNKGALIAKGQYILFINGDDELVEEGFSAIISSLQSQHADVICGITAVGSLSEPTEILTATPKRLPFFNTIPHPSSFVRTSLMKTYPFREDLRIASDYDFFLRLFLGRRSFKSISAVTALHHRGGMSSDQELSAAEIELIRKDQLGWKYPFIEAAGNIYRALKKPFRRDPSMSRNSTAVVVGLSGGLGNQIFQYAAGRALSLRLNKPLKLDLSWFADRSDRKYALWPFAISAKTLVQYPFLPNRLTSLECSISRRFSPRRMGVPIYREPHFQYDPNFEAINNPVYLEGYWQSSHYFTLQRDAISNDLSLEATVPTACQTILDEIQSCDAICLHIRRGDYINDPVTARTHGVCSPSYYYDGTSALIKDFPHAKCFLFSDDPTWVRENIKPPCEYTVVDVNSGEDAHWDLFLMAACKHFIIANSSLSWWAAWLGRSDDKRVIAPSKWFLTSEKDTKDLIPQDWERL